MTNAQIEQKIKRLAAASVDYNVAGQWFKLTQMTDDFCLKQEILKTAGAALLYTGKSDVYQKSVRSLIDDVTVFEQAMEMKCRECDGTGETGGTCKKCHGSGRCSYASCRGGSILVRGIGTLPSRWERCRECKGTGVCQNCMGGGNVKEKCRACGGRRIVKSRDAILKAYRDHALAASLVLESNIAEAEREQIARGKAIDPRTVEQTKWDLGQEYRFPPEDIPALKKMLRQKSKSISVNVDTSLVKDSGFDLASVRRSIQADVQDKLNDLGFLHPVSANWDLIDEVNAENGVDAQADVPDYILICRLTYANVSYDTNPVSVSFKAYFELYDREENATRFSKTISKIGVKALPSGVEDTMQGLFTTAAVEYMEQIADQIGPVGIVIETRGGGRYAYVSLGTKAGLTAGGRVQFLQKMDDSLADLIATSYAADEDESDEDYDPRNKGKRALDRRARLPLASVSDGHVVESTLPEHTAAWIEVDKFNIRNPLVKKGMAVRIVSMPRKQRPLAPTSTY